MSTDAFWQDKHVIITGASSGIGWALAEYAARRGARVGAIARRAEQLEQLVAEIGMSSGRAAWALADVSDAAAVRSAIEQLETELGPCDVLVANAGLHRYTPGTGFDPADFAAVHATNVLGVTNAIAVVAPGMVARGRGNIAAVASIAGLLGLPEVAAYSSSKAALINLMEAFALDLHPHGVRVTTLCPGFIDTPFIAGHDRRVLKFLLTAEQAAARMGPAIAQGRRERWFPWPTWLMARIARAVPFWLYRRMLKPVPKQGAIEPPTGSGPLAR